METAPEPQKRHAAKTQAVEGPVPELPAGVQLARDDVSALLAGDVPNEAAEFADLEDYWLPAAANTLLAWTGNKVKANDWLAIAEHRDTAEHGDSVASSTFVVLSSILLGVQEKIPARLLANALPSLDERVTLGQRAVWLTCADGWFGEAGRALIKRYCSKLFAAQTPEQAEEWVTGWLGAVHPDPAATRPMTITAGLFEVAACHEATNQLVVLRTWLDGALDHTNEPAADPDDLVAAALGCLIEDDPSWSADFGDTMALLGTDALDEDWPQRQDLAIRVSGPSILVAKERLAEVATRMSPEFTRLRTSQGEVLITSTGPDETSLDALAAVVMPASSADQRSQRLAIGLTVLAVLLLLGALVVGWPLLVAGLALGAGGGVFWYQQRRLDTARREEMAAKWKDALHEIEEGTADFQKQSSELSGLRSHAEANVAVIDKLLRANFGSVSA
jgi:hypothetical protein